MIFGAKNSASFYMLLGELRAHYSHHLPQADQALLTELAQQVDVGRDPPYSIRAKFAQAVTDSRHSGIQNAHGVNPERRVSSFVVRCSHTTFPPPPLP